MIFNRTLSDVTAAIEIRDSKVKKFAELTQDDINKLERGLVTHNTLNRIEEKQTELRTLLRQAGYYMGELVTKQWTVSDIFRKDDFERIIKNTDALRKAFFTYTDTPNTPNAKYHYENFNDLEKILDDLERMIDGMKNLYRICGTFNCGEDNTN